MKVLVFHNSDSTIKEHTRTFIGSICSRFDQIYFISRVNIPVESLWPNTTVVEGVIGTSEQNYIYFLKQSSIPESAQVCLADDSVAYLFDFNRVFDLKEGKSDFWCFFFNRVPTVHADPSFVYFDRETFKSLLALLQEIDPQVSPQDAKKFFATMSYKFMRSGLSLNFIFQTFFNNTMPLILSEWPLFSNSNFPAVSRPLYNRGWRLDNFGIPLREVFSEKKFLSHIENNQFLAPNFKDILEDLNK